MPFSAREDFSPAGIGSATVGVCLYLFTAFFDLVLAGAARFALVYPLALMWGLALATPLSATTIAMVASLLPVIASLSSLFVSGQGWWWRRRAGLRRAGAEEQEALRLAFSLFAPADPLPRLAVLDDPRPLAAVRGATLIVSRGLIESASLAAVLAHERGHLRSLDGRLTEALDRLSLWDDPLGSADGFEVEGRAGGARRERAGLLYLLIRTIICLAGGGVGQMALCPLWSAYWRHREFVADAAAATVGQGHDLARHLRDEVMPLEVSRQVGIFRLADHPPTALRIERLLGAGGGTK